MRIRSLLFTASFLLLFSVPGFPQGVGNSCDISGTWYGGSDPAFPYLLSFTPVGAGRYYSSGQNGYDVHQFGYSAATAWVGETIKNGSTTFDSYIMSYWITEGAPLPELDIVHSRITFIDCDTFTSTIDIFGGYFSFTPDRTPFVTPPDLSFLSGGPIIETYHRMPTTLTGLQTGVPPARPTAAPKPGPPTPPVAASTDSKKHR